MCIYLYICIYIYTYIYCTYIGLTDNTKAPSACLFATRIRHNTSYDEEDLQRSRSKISPLKPNPVETSKPGRA